MQKNARSGGRKTPRRESWLARQLRRRPRPLWMLIGGHVLALGIALLIYALPHHVIPSAGVAVGITSSRESMANPTAAATASDVPVGETPTPDAPAAAASATVEPSVTPSPTPAVDTVGSFRVKYADLFTDGEVVRTDTTYQSANVNITIYDIYEEERNVRYHIADIYVADISCLVTGFANDQYGHGYSEWPVNIARRFGSIVTINGDYYGGRRNGVVIRNGTLYRDERNVNDVCVLYWDGTMKTFSPDEFDAETEMANGAYQSWNFGPMLLDENGTALTEFNSDVTSRHPRSVIGYYEPGHYCFVAVDGRCSDSEGMRMSTLASLMESLGCKQAFNLDGGQTSMLYAGATLLNQPYKGGRKCSDVIMILDQVTQ